MLQAFRHAKSERDVRDGGGSLRLASNGSMEAFTAKRQWHREKILRATECYPGILCPAKLASRNNSHKDTGCVHETFREKKSQSTNMNGEGITRPSYIKLEDKWLKW